MFCKACNTRLELGDSQCPNCGRTANQSPPRQRKKVPLSPSTHDDVDLELGEPVPNDSGTTGDRQEKPVKRAKAKRQSGGENTADLRSLREMIAADPSLIETGLRIKDGRGIRADGSADTEVGEIDLIGLDSNGSLLVLMVADEAKGDELVGEMLQRIGWVRRHVGEPDQEVRGVILTAARPEELGYAAAAVADSVSFKTWRIAIVLDDIEL